MERKTRVFITLGVLVLLIGGIYFFTDWFSKVTGYILGEDMEVRIARCLNEKGTILYMKDDCVECFRQEQLLGKKALELIEQTKCGENSCLGLREFPAWEIDGQFYYGVKELKDLSEISGCEIK